MLIVGLVWIGGCALAKSLMIGSARCDCRIEARVLRRYPAVAVFGFGIRESQYQFTGRERGRPVPAGRSAKVSISSFASLGRILGPAMDYLSSSPMLIRDGWADPTPSGRRHTDPCHPFSATDNKKQD